MDFESPEAGGTPPPPARLDPPIGDVHPSLDDTARQSPTAAERMTALLEVILCSGYPTQIALGATFAAFGFRAESAPGTLNIGFVVALSLIDTVFLVGVIVLFLRAHGESPRDVFLGSAPVWREAQRGLPLTLVALTLAFVVMLGIQQVAPWLHTVEHNPLQDLVQTKRDAMLFAVVVVVAGGVREELQRAFLLRRFERWLGGARVGIVVTSIAFGAGHLLQGADAAIATALLGAFWAVVYIRRRSAVASVVSHAGFNLLQLAQFLAIPR
jgi:membrane protease YdiL (CAAX protease family)